MSHIMIGHPNHGLQERQKSGTSADRHCIMTDPGPWRSAASGNGQLKTLCAECRFSCTQRTIAFYKALKFNNLQKTSVR